MSNENLFCNRCEKIAVGMIVDYDSLEPKEYLCKEHLDEAGILRVGKKIE